MVDRLSEIAVVTGSDYLENTKKAVTLIGGMDKYVPKNSKVAILANPQSNNPGTYTKPEIVRAAIQMCKAAGASEISCIGLLSTPIALLCSAMILKISWQSKKPMNMD